MKSISIILSITALLLTSCGEAPHGHSHDGENSHDHGEQQHENHEQESFTVESDSLESHHSHDENHPH